MEKIKIILVTLLCMVGVMGASAQETATVTINNTTGSIGGNKTWTSKQVFDGGSNMSIVDMNSNGVARYGMSFDNGSLCIGVEGLWNDVTHEMVITAPLGWNITGFKFTPVCERSQVVYGTTVCDNNKEFKKGGLSLASTSINIKSQRTFEAGSAIFNGFEVTLERKYIPSINDNLANTVQGHWFWVQDTPTAGNLYKIVNATSNETDIIAIGPRPNNTVASGSNSSESSVLVNDMVRAGEWLITNSGDGVTITSVDGDDVVGVYESHMSVGNYKLGADKNQVWKIDDPATIYGVEGHYIHCLFNILVDRTECYLRLSDSFQWIQDATGLNVGNMGWSGQGGSNLLAVFNGPINSVQHLWNFYSIEQYDCYVDFMTAYEDFMALYPEGQSNDDYMAVYNDVNAEGKRWQGENDETREETYEIIDRMLNVIATIKGGSEHIDPTPADGHEWPIDNPGAEHETSFDAWSSRRIPTSNTSKAVKIVSDNAHKDAAMFELKNATMSQIVTDIQPGVYELSVYWKTDNNSNAEITLNAKSSAEDRAVKVKGNEASPKTEDNGFTKAVVEVVVVDGRLTVSASADTQNGGSVYLDDFELKYICKNYWYEEENTRVYRGVFLYEESSGTDAGKTPDGKARKDPNGKASAVVDDKIPYADITQAYFVSFEFDNSANPNGLCYTKAETTKTIKTKTTTTEPATEEINVIRGNECAQLKFADKHPYSSKWDFDAQSAQYEMKSFGTGKDDTTEDEVTYGTLMLPYSLDNVSTNHPYIEVYSTKDVSAKGHLALVKVDKVEANTPYIIKYTKKTSDGNEFKPYFNVLSADQIEAESRNTIKTNCFVGAYKESPIPGGGNCYVLQKQNGRLAFYRVNRDDLKISPFRCYLELPEGTTLSKISIVVEDENETDGIRVIEDAESADILYDLLGRRIENISQSGIYVKNGKKFLVK